MSARLKLATSQLVDGEWFVVTRCQDCEAPKRISTDQREPGAMEKKFGALVVCDSCSATEDAAREAAELRSSLQARVVESGLPKAARGFTFGEMHAGGKRDAAIVQARKWAEAEQPRGMILWGPVGSGKSRLAATAALERIRGGDRVQWVSVAMLIAQTQAAFGDLDRELALKVLTGSRGLVLDDLDKVAPTESVVSRLFVAIEARITAESPLLVTTNLAPAQLTEKFGEAITSRLLGYALGRVRELDGVDRRLKLGAA